MFSSRGLARHRLQAGGTLRHEAFQAIVGALQILAGAQPLAAEAVALARVQHQHDRERFRQQRQQRRRACARARGREVGQVDQLPVARRQRTRLAQHGAAGGRRRAGDDARAIVERAHGA
ncbi:hypothetical protein [Massilia phosphatilytica]